MTASSHCSLMDLSRCRCSRLETTLDITNIDLSQTMILVWTFCRRNGLRTKRFLILAATLACLPLNWVRANTDNE
jgi:hypothetical protein